MQKRPGAHAPGLSLFAILRHDFFGGELAVYHTLDAGYPIVFGDVDGADTLGVAA